MAASPNIVSQGNSMRFVQSEATAAQRTWMVYLSNSADGTPATGKTIATSDIRISKAGGAFGNATGTVTEVSLGWYKVVFAAADLDTLGALAVEMSVEAGVDTLHVVHEVVARNQYLTDAALVDLVFDEAFSGHTTAGTFGLLLQQLKGLANGNAVVDGGSGVTTGPTYDSAGMMTAARLRVFDSAAHAAAATAGGNETGCLATYTIAASGANGRMTLYRTTES
jgi:hypothetical protein